MYDSISTHTCLRDLFLNAIQHAPAPILLKNPVCRIPAYIVLEKHQKNPCNRLQNAKEHIDRFCRQFSQPFRTQNPPCRHPKRRWNEHRKFIHTLKHVQKKRQQRDRQNEQNRRCVRFLFAQPRLLQERHGEHTAATPKQTIRKPHQTSAYDSLYVFLRFRHRFCHFLPFLPAFSQPLSTQSPFTTIL